METRDLEYVLAVETHGGIGRAAEALDMTQPALTKAVQRVEAQLGVPLFERTTLGMRVTQAGAVFLERARRIRLEYEDAIKEMRGIQTGEQGMLRLGYSPSMPNALVLGACRQLIRERPVARLRLTMRVARELMDLLQAGELDLAIAPLPRQVNPALVSRELFTDRLAVVADENHPLLRRRNLTLADLTDQQWLLPSSHVLIRQRIDAAFTELGLPAPILRVETDFGSTALFDLVRGTEMLCIAGSTSNGAQTGLRPIALRPDALDLGRRVGVMSRAGAYLSPLALRMIGIFEARMQ
ncbi:DNA-binding transcriptional LysR family regulator [Cupriavidus metallidurans]|jgi:DNA-binding transcriptional LysR family regulator|uniref:LysR family transcriptional regulator n=1 Tax=Cupriavidus TaxID=106589 RepID=UPI000493590E|nr:LysR family transcriptional regulator [Cupriavidus metallidurans]AVA34268.1 LysR family transcriptional regulator [Cupriavidus metallidurans]KWW32974.1 HTH-type transcriptional regulator CynR [Cupriavidus metallidurans]MDE4922081.1 LysR family transcriptional regulator [Cupriavidus metallidurans]